LPYKSNDCNISTQNSVIFTKCQHLGLFFPIVNVLFFFHFWNGFANVLGWFLEKTGTLYE
jgi:hypothetical protein